ncbi:NAD(P)-binding protein [Parathielavia appendiculata]|uniref:NAD(P)-binding protein n=1 Tax=Parathielavia appendiculata TaxID=2587402 RepID=A0AAN6U7H4_9PEZI|nr:NAD(P)-binding protein [Parathielavia appendiculata]
MAVSAGCLVISVLVLLPVGLVKSAGDAVLSVTRPWRRNADTRGGQRRCVVILGASSGIGVALALEYAAPNTHLVLIARNPTRLNWVAEQVEARGATAAVHSLDLFEPANIAKLYRLLDQVDAEAGGIDVAISCAGVTGHRSDVLGPGLAYVPPPPEVTTDDDFISPTTSADSATANKHSHPETAFDSSLWGATTASRLLQVNVAAAQAFILHTWELMKARQLASSSGPESGSTHDDTTTLSHKKPTIIVLSSSTAFFTPSTFALYASSKSYLYTLVRSLQHISSPLGISVLPVTPGFMDTGMTETMIRAGATVPRAVLGDPRKLAQKVRRVTDGEGGSSGAHGGAEGGVVFYPSVQVVVLWALRAVNPVLETTAMWAATAMGVASWFWS